MNILFPNVFKYKKIFINVSQKLLNQKFVERILIEMFSFSIEYLIFFYSNFINECYIHTIAKFLKSRKKSFLFNLRRVIFAINIDSNIKKKISLLFQIAYIRYKICVNYFYEICKNNYKNCNIHINS